MITSATLFFKLNGRFINIYQIVSAGQDQRPAELVSLSPLLGDVAVYTIRMSNGQVYCIEDKDTIKHLEDIITYLCFNG